MATISWYLQERRMWTEAFENASVLAAGLPMTNRIVRRTPEKMLRGRHHSEKFQTCAYCGRVKDHRDRRKVSEQSHLICTAYTHMQNLTQSQQDGPFLNNEKKNTKWLTILTKHDKTTT